MPCGMRPPLSPCALVYGLLDDPLQRIRRLALILREAREVSQGCELAYVRSVVDALRKRGADRFASVLPKWVSTHHPAR